MNTHISYRSQDKTCERSKFKNKTGGYTLTDLLLILVAVGVIIPWWIHSRNHLKQSQPAISKEQNDNPPEVAAKRQSVEEFQRQAHKAFTSGFSNALEENKQRILDECLSGTSPSILTATGSKVNSLYIDPSYGLEPASVDDALREISSYTADVTIFWKGPNDSEGCSEFELISNPQIGKDASIRLLKSQISANSN
jgi:hypothetical protein